MLFFLLCEQVMPQLLYFFELDETVGEDSGIDFGTLLVFSCAASFKASAAYVSEFVWREMPDM